jgi:hypothetical protein
MTRYILAIMALVAFISLPAYGQSSRTTPAGTLPSATITALTVGSGNLTFSENGESIKNGTDGEFKLVRDEAGTVTLTVSDGSQPTAFTISSGTTGTLTLVPGGAGAVVLGLDTGTTLDITAGGAMTIGDPTATDSLVLDSAGASSLRGATVVIGDAATTAITINTTGDTVTTVRPDTGAVTYTCTDDDANAECIYDSGGTGNATLGSADTTAAQINSAGAVTVTAGAGEGANFVNRATGTVVVALQDFADTTDDDMDHAGWTVNCTDTGTGTEDCDVTFFRTTAGANVNIINADADGDTNLSATSNLVHVIGGGSGEIVYNSTTGSVVNSVRDYADTTDDDMAHVQFTTNCTDTGTGTEDCDYTIAVTEAGANRDVITIDGDGTTTIGAGVDSDIVLSADGGAGITHLTEDAGTYRHEYNLYGATADDDMNHIVIITECTDVSSGAEDCDYKIAQVEAGAAADVRFFMDADVGIILGSAATDAATITTDGTGDDELTVPAQSIDTDETTFVVQEAIEFCGQGQNTADGYFGPQTSRGTELVAGSATCDALDAAAVGDADEIPFTNFQKAYTVNGMYCYVATGGTDDVITFALYDDTSKTAIDCQITLDGGFEDCNHDRAEQVSVAAASLVAIEIDATTADENLSDVDFHCTVFISH